MEDRKKKFFDIIRARSNENEKAINLLLGERCYSLTGAILRMELDSLLRVHDFVNATILRQETLLDNFFGGNRWLSTDRIMVKNISHKLGWTEHIYDFCCAFIHLSPYHDWAYTSDIPNLTREKRHSIVCAIKNQQNDTWGYDTALVIDEDFCFDDLIPFIPYIFKKLRQNLLCEIRDGIASQ